mmetsp:Transcript_34195/g.105776  ORF Transcript_34195/g.105776 Transcript_34195/m.105776 type:complete len:178 (-) Transcript_34195:61-594(-)
MFRRCVLALLAVSSAAAAACGTCGEPGCPNCDHVDFGSCGNACCKLTLKVDLDATAATAALNASIHAGGPDGNYAARPTDEGTSGFADLRPYNVSAQFIGQAWHTTSGAARYNDTVDMNVASLGDGSIVKFFSLSLVGGALGDAGQNFKNIVALAQDAFGDDVALEHADESCPEPGR